MFLFAYSEAHNKKIAARQVKWNIGVGFSTQNSDGVFVDQPPV